MSDHVAQSDHDSDGSARKSMHNYETSWMSHWKQTSCKPSIKAHNDLPLCSGLKDDGADIVTLGRSKWAHPEMACHNRLPPISLDPEQLDKSRGFLEKDNLAVSTSLKLDVGSSSKIVPHRFKGGGAQMQSFMCQQEEIDQSIPFGSSKEHVPDAKFCSYSTFWIHGKKTDSMMESRENEPSLSRQNHSSPSLHETSTSHGQLPTFLNKQNPKGPPKFSQKTDGFFITKKTDVNLSSLGQVFRDSKVSSQLKRKMFGDFLSLSPSFTFQGQPEVNLLPRRSSIDSEGIENVDNVKTSAVCLRNESSAETDPMELDFFQKSHLSAVPWCAPNQKTKATQNSSSSQTTIASGRDETDKRMANTNNDQLHDLNQEPFAVRVTASLAGDRETSPSRTLSLDADHLLSHAERPTNSKCTSCPNGPLGAEPGSRWVKRLRLSNSDSLAHGTKSSNVGEASSREKVNKFFSKILKCSTTSSEPTVGRCHGKPQIALDQTVVLLKNGDSSSTDSGRTSQDISLSLSWIRRLAKNRAASPEKKSEAVELCEPQSSKAAVDEFQKKQFPSIAAMALMGKAMRSFHPCEFRRRGSLIVWNTSEPIRNFKVEKFRQ